MDNMFWGVITVLAGVVLAFTVGRVLIQLASGKSSKEVWRGSWLVLVISGLVLGLGSAGITGLVKTGGGVANTVIDKGLTEVSTTIGSTTKDPASGT